MSKATDIIIEAHDRYSRLRSIEWWDQDRIRKARVLVAGAGALGNEVLKGLALIGVGQVLIVDFDTVEITNLSRSVLFRPEDINKPKAAVAAQRIHEMNPDVQAEFLQGDVVWDVGLGSLMRFDAVIGCVDNREARLGLNRNCWKVNVPWIDGALGIIAGQVRNFVPPDSACYECGMTEEDYRDLNLRYSCQLLAQEGLLRGQIATTPVSAAIVAAIQIQEFLKLLHGQAILAGHEIEYDGQHYRYRLTSLKRREGCFSHEETPLTQVKLLPDARALEMTAGQLLEIVRTDLGPQAYVLLDREVITHLVCPNGHGIEHQIFPRHKAGSQLTRCPRCGLERTTHFTHKIEDLALANTTLDKLGIPSGHILMGCYGAEQYFYELSGDDFLGQRLVNVERRR